MQRHLTKDGRDYYQQGGPVQFGKEKGYSLGDWEVHLLFEVSLLGAVSGDVDGPVDFLQVTWPTTILNRPPGCAFVPLE